MPNAFASDHVRKYSRSAIQRGLSNWNVSNVTDMFGMFGDCSVFNQDLSSWNVSNVTDMRLMFLDCSVFNQDLSNWSFTTTPEHADWCIGAPICNDQKKWPPQLRTGITNANFKEIIYYYYLGTSAEKQLIITLLGSIEEWDVSQVTYMNNAFASDPSGNIPGVQFNADLSGWNVSNVTDMFGMFGACSVFNQDLSSWNVSNVTDMRLMFLDCSVFNQDLSNWSFTTTPEHADWCTGAPICDDQTKWPPQLRTGTGITDANFKELINKYYLGTNEEKQEIISTYGIIEEWDVSQVTYMNNAFASDPSGNIPGVQFNADLSGWNVSNVTDMGFVFSGCSVFNQDLSNWNVSNVTNMGYMFLDCSVFNQDLSNWSFTTTPEHTDWCTGAPICDDQTKWPPQLRTGTDITDANFKELIRKYYLGTQAEKQAIITLLVV